MRRGKIRPGGDVPLFFLYILPALEPLWVEAQVSKNTGPHRARTLASFGMATRSQYIRICHQHDLRSRSQINWNLRISIIIRKMIRFLIVFEQ